MLMGFLTTKAFPFIVLLGLLIFVHELGHYLMAVWNGVRVEVFSLGFGKKIWKYQRGYTTYCVSMIPLGGYVKMYGDQPGSDIPVADQKVSFTHKTVWQRISIVLAGPLMNFLFAVLIFAFLVGYGEDYRKARLGEVLPNSPAALAGLSSDDLILKAQGQSVETWDQLQDELDKNMGGNVSLTVLKSDGQQQTLEVPVVAKDNPNILSSKKVVGVIEGVEAYSEGTYVGLQEISPLWKVGMLPGDRIETVNGKVVRTWGELNLALSSIGESENITFGLERYEIPFESKTPQKLTVTLSRETFPGVLTLARLGLESSELYLAALVKDSPAMRAGLKQGDRVTRIDGGEIRQWEEILKAVSQYKGDSPMMFQVRREGETLDLPIKPQMTTQMSASGAEDKRFTIGIRPFANIAMPETIRIASSNPWDMLVKGTERTLDVSYMILMSFKKLITAEISSKNIGGIISIGQAASETFQMGLADFLRMMALVSVNLFILNLLPIPVLDGGHLVFYVVEALKGSPLSLKKMEVAQQIGIVLLMSLMVLSLFNDVLRLFGKF